MNRLMTRRAAPRRTVAACAVACALLLTGGTSGSDVQSAGRGAATIDRVDDRMIRTSWAEVELLEDLRRRSLASSRYVGDRGEVVTAHQLRLFLERKGSPMADHVDVLIASANRYRVDPRFVVAVAGVESSFGKRCRGHNAWGWNNGKTRWGSWPEAIDSYSRLISEKYPNWRNIRRVAPRYNPNTPEAWGRKVAYLMASIERMPA